MHYDKSLTSRFPNNVSIKTCWRKLEAELPFVDGSIFMSGHFVAFATVTASYGTYFSITRSQPMRIVVGFAVHKAPVIVCPFVTIWPQVVIS